MYKADFKNLEDIFISKEAIDHVEILEQKGSIWKIKIENQIHTVDFEEYNLHEKTYRVIIDGVPIELELKSELDLLIEKLGFDTANEDHVLALKAPMPGLVVDIKIEEGEKIDTGQPLVVLEAMKMENIIKSKNVTTIKSINVSIGDKVEKGAVLIEFEE